MADHAAVHPWHDRANQWQSDGHNRYKLKWKSMTIAALLHHHGVQVPRFVTVNGRIVFDGVRSTSSGFAHTTFGSVTPVANHTFHGGSEEPDDVSHSGRTWWDDDERIGRHVSAMERSFPGFVYLPPEDDGGPCWGGVIDTGRGNFKVMIMPRRDEGLPRAAVLDLRLGVHAGRRWVPSPHLYLNGNLCVAGENDWDPAHHTVATVTAWAAHWLAAYTEWRITRRWPTEGVYTIAA
jgi:hypothetical protein